MSGLLNVIAGKAKNMEKIVKKSGSFLTVCGKTISFVHQSAKDYLIEKAGLSIFPFGPGDDHRRMFTKSVQTMEKILRRDMYGLSASVLLSTRPRGLNQINLRQRLTPVYV